MLRSKIIALTGNMGSGKTAAVNYLLEKAKMDMDNFRKPMNIKFAAGIYDVVNFLCKRVGVPFEKNKLRPIMQYVGQEMRSQYGDQIWVDAWKTEYFIQRTETKKPLLVFCDDCRYNNEAQMLKDLGAKIVLVSSTDDVRKARGVDLTHSDHSSEMGVSRRYIDHSIFNNGSLDLFHQELDKLYEDTLDKETYQG